MPLFLKNTVSQINIETRQGNAPVVRAQQAPAAAPKPDQNHTPERVDAVTGGTQGIARYFAAQMQVQAKPPTPETDDT